MRSVPNHQLRSDSNISIAEYDVPVALTSERDSAMRIPDLATRIGWERSRLSHQVRRMREAGLVDVQRSASDGRATEVVLTQAGRRTVQSASPRHADFVQRVFSKDSIVTRSTRSPRS